jgi:septum formation topological specificity factor MinE
MRPTRRGFIPSHKWKSQSRQHLQVIQAEKQSSTTGPSFLEHLPTEILSEIVAMYFERSNKIAVITGISRRIRQVVFGMSSVWRSIKLLTRDDIRGPRYKYEDVRTFTRKEVILLISL